MLLSIVIINNNAKHGPEAEINPNHSKASSFKQLRVFTIAMSHTIIYINFILIKGLQEQLLYPQKRASQKKLGIV